MPISIVEEIVRKLGAHGVRSQADLARAVHNGLPLTVLEGLGLAGMSEQEIATFVISQRARRRRAESRQPLTIDESDRVVRLLRVQTLAEDGFGDREKANRWLRRPSTELGHETPLAVARTEAGARVIEAILGKVAWGAAA